MEEQARKSYLLLDNLLYWAKSEQKFFMFNATTTSGSTDSRIYAVDNGRQNGYGIMARSETDLYSPVLLRIFSGGATETVSIGAIAIAARVGVW